MSYYDQEISFVHYCLFQLFTYLFKYEAKSAFINSLGAKTVYQICKYSIHKKKRNQLREMLLNDSLIFQFVCFAFFLGVAESRMKDVW